MWRNDHRSSFMSLNSAPDASVFLNWVLAQKNSFPNQIEASFRVKKKEIIIGKDIDDDEEL